ncbi:MAG: hypothetical protein V7717_08650 [Porticoccaceae bacterium]
MKIIGKQTFKQVIAMLVVVLLASQPLAAIAELHLFYQSGSEHSSFDFLHNNSSPSKHSHTRHQLAGVKIAVELITIKSEVVLDEAAVAVKTVETVDTSATPEGESCGHTHTTCSALLASAAPVTSLASKQQNLHFYLSPQSFEYSASLYRPPRP